MLKEPAKKALVSLLVVISQKATLFASEIQKAGTLEQVKLLSSEFPEMIPQLRESLKQQRGAVSQEIIDLVEDLQLRATREKVALDA